MEIMNILKTYQFSPTAKLFLIQIGFYRFEIRINSNVKAIEWDYDRACEQFESFKNFYC